MIDFSFATYLYFYRMFLLFVVLIYFLQLPGLFYLTYRTSTGNSPLSWILRLGGIFFRVPRNSQTSGKCITRLWSLFQRIISPMDIDLLQTQQVFLYLLVICFQLKSWCFKPSAVLTARLVLSCLFIISTFYPCGIIKG